MEQLPKITVVTVSFNAADCIAATMESVVRQTYPALEYVVIDGASTDGTVEIVKKYADRVSHFVSERDGGIYYGMNKGIDAATGDYVIFMNCGDRFADDEVVGDVAAFIAANPGSDVVYGNSYKVYDYGTYLSKPSTILGTRMGLSHQTVFAKTSLLRGHKFDTRYRYAADFEQLSSLKNDGAAFVHFDRAIATEEMRSGTTVSNYDASAREMYAILEGRGVDVKKESRSQLRRKRIVYTFKKKCPKFISNPVLRLVAKVYKPL